ncbi:hypothetical protein AOLI_G00267110 [Acnodon oligacanthus]
MLEKSEKKRLRTCDSSTYTEDLDTGGKVEILILPSPPAPGIFPPSHQRRTVTVVPKPGKEWTVVAMESSLGELVKALSLLQQTQHQALLDAQRENQARFEALARGQEADRRLLRSLLLAPSTPAPTPATISISKMTPQDDPEAFVELFERAAGDWG